MSIKSILSLTKKILLAVIPIIREDKKIEDSVIVILETIILIMGFIIAL